MSDNSAGTKTCSTCHGEPWGFKTKCPTCSGTGLDTTGAVAGETTTPGYQGSSQQREFDLALQAQVIAALTAERDELRERIESLSSVVDSRERWKSRAGLLEIECREMRERASRQNHLLDEMERQLREAMSERNEARAETQRLRHELVELVKDLLAGTPEGKP